MDTKIEKLSETERDVMIDQPEKRYNPDALDHTKELRIMSIEATAEYTRIDFIYRSSMIYDNGGWIQMEGDSYIQPKGSTQKYRLVRAIGIPITPLKHYFKRKGEFHTYTLIFPPLPKKTQKIDIIEKLAPGNYFNFFDVDFSTWMTVMHPLEIAKSTN
jgi:hypothetical protein